MDDPRITLVMPSYNQATYLTQAIESVLAQEYPNLEFFVLDGGSSDESRDVIQRFSGHLTWWRSAPDDGQAAAIREGFDRASGDILCWLNSDDLLAPGALHRVVEVWRAHGPGILIAGGVQLFGDVSSNNHHVPWFTAARETPVRMPVASILDMAWHWFPGEFYYQPEVFFPADEYRQVGGVDPSFYYTMDYDLWVRYALAGVPAVIIDDTLACYREHAAQKTDDKEALYDEMIRTANQYLLESGLSDRTIRRLRRSNELVRHRLLREGAKQLAYARRRLRSRSR